MRSGEVTLHGHRISYREAGEDREPVILLIHGITSSSATNHSPFIAIPDHG